MSFAESLYAANPNAVKNPSAADVAWWETYRTQYGDDATASAFNQAVANVTGTAVWTGPVPAPSPAPSPAPAPSSGAPSPAPAPTGVGSPAPAPAATPTPPPANGAESATGTNAEGTATDPPKPEGQWFPGVSNRTVTLGAALLVAGAILFGGK